MFKIFNILQRYANAGSCHAETLEYLKRNLYLSEFRLLLVENYYYNNTVPEALSLRGLSLRFLRNVRKLNAKNTTKLGNQLRFFCVQRNDNLSSIRFPALYINIIHLIFFTLCFINLFQTNGFVCFAKYKKQFKNFPRAKVVKKDSIPKKVQYSSDSRIVTKKCQKSVTVRAFLSVLVLFLGVFFSKICKKSQNVTVRESLVVTHYCRRDETSIENLTP